MIDGGHQQADAEEALIITSDGSGSLLAKPIPRDAALCSFRGLGLAKGLRLIGRRRRIQFLPQASPLIPWMDAIAHWALSSPQYLIKSSSIERPPAVAA